VSEVIAEAAAAQVLPLLGSDVSLLHGTQASDAFGGGDLDCVVPELDHQWPLRLGDGWRLCQCLRYDATGWYWILERAGNVIAVDTLAADPAGIGCYGFPARLLDGSPPPRAARSAYLTLKRLRKQDRDPRAWAQVAELARSDSVTFSDLLAAMLGQRLGRTVAHAVLSGADPGARLGRAVRRRRVMLLLAHPTHLVRLGRLKAARLFDRLLRPTGLVVVLAGPDGTGKSMLARALPTACAGLFRRSLHVHFRNGFLPRPGTLIGRPAHDSSSPHGRSAHGRVLSVLLLAYHWVDALAEGWLRLQVLRRRTALVVIERGWWDIAVDPLRYRLSVSPWLVKMLGRFLPRPDLVLLLVADPLVVRRRKPELPIEAIDVQLARWRSVAPKRRLVRLDADAVPEDVLGAARELIVEKLEQRAMSRVGAGWANLGFRDGEPRLVLPRAPRRAAATALSLYRPSRRSMRVAWWAARGFARIGLWRLLPRGVAPPTAAREATAAYLPAGGTVATAKANHPARYNALVFDRDGAAVAFAKVACDQPGRAALERERDAIARLGPRLDEPVRAPRVIAAEPGVLVLEPLEACAPMRPGLPPSEVVRALGPLASAGLSHGDFAPWNLLRLRDGWVLVDWEQAAPTDSPFLDLAHYLVQSHILLGRPKLDDLVSPPVGGWVWKLVATYAHAAGIPLEGWPAALEAYLDRAPETPSIDPRQAEASIALQRLRERLVS
jgi:hypothetical protein